MNKSLLEIQKSVRELENKIGDISKEIQKLYVDIEEMRSDKHNTDIDYAQIEALSKYVPFSRHPIRKLNDEKICRIYLEMLLNIVRMDQEEEITVNRLIFLQWLQSEAKIDWSLAELYKECFAMKASDYHEMMELLPVEYFEFFVVDALMVANIGGTAKLEIYEYIVDLVSVLNIDKVRFEVLAIISKTALCKKLEKVKKKKMSAFLDVIAFSDMITKYEHYIDKDIIERELERFRKIVAEKKVDRLSWKVQTGQNVKKNQLIATYYDDSSWYKPFGLEIEQEIFAPFSGTIFIVTCKGIEYGVISHPNDNKASVKAWIRGKKD